MIDPRRVVSRLATTPHTGRAMKVVRILSIMGTIRGAVTTVLLAVSAIGGVATVQTVRTELVHDKKATAPARTAAPTATPTRTPFDVASTRHDYEQRLAVALQQNATAIDDLRKVAIVGPTQLESLIADAKQKLQTRYETAMAQLSEVAPTPVPGSTAAPSASFSVITLDALVRVATADMSTIVVVTARAATTVLAVPPSAPPRTPVPTLAPTPAPTPVPRTPSPSPTHSASPSPSPTHSASPSPRKT